MKFFRNAIILVVIGILAGFSYWYFEVKKAKEKKEKEEKEALLFEQKDAKITKIVIKKRGDKKPIIAIRKTKKKKKKEDGKEKEINVDYWVITSPVNTNGDLYTLDTMANDIKKAKREEVVWDSLEKEKDYGLDNPELSIRFKYENDERERGIDFGIKTLDGKKVFAKVVGQNKIYAVASGIYDSLNKSLLDVRDKTISPFGKEDIVSISLISPHNMFTLKKREDGWYFVDGVKASTSRVELYEGHLRWGNFREVVKEKAEYKDLAEYGLDKPRLIVKYGLKKGKDYIFIVGDPIKEGDVTYYYATRNTDDMIFEVTSDLVMKLDTTKFLLKDRHIFNFKYDDVNKVMLKNGDKSFTFIKKGEDWYFADTDKKVEKDYKIDGIIRSLEDAEYEEFEPIKKGDPKYEKTGIDNPKYEVILYFKDESRKPIKVLVSKKSEKTERVYISPDNGETAYYTFGYFVDNIPEKRKDLMGSD